MKALIYGVGRMRQAIGYAMNEFGYDIAGVDVDRTGIDNLRKLLGKDVSFSLSSTDFNFAEHYDPDIVISSLPYHQTERVATWCIDNGIRYCDLGGRVDVSQSINDYAKNATAPVFTDLGLAPGWVNIVAEQGYKRVYDATDVRMMVGGIPLKRPVGPLKYFMTWSLDGLLNEYRDDCEILVDGKIQVVPGLSQCEVVDPEWEECITLEAFCTSGGAAHTTRRMKTRGVKNCIYKTLRWSGHHELMDFFMNKCKMSDDELKNILETSAEYESTREDVVVIMVEVRNGSGLTWKKEYVVECDETFTAMQKCTAFSISSVADLIGRGIFDNRVEQNRGGDIKLSNVLNYSDIPFDKFEKNLKKLCII